jgi:hypothetical protein
MRSFTDDSGLKNFSFYRMSARTLAAAVIFDSRQGRVADGLEYLRPRPPSWWRRAF